MSTPSPLVPQGTFPDKGKSHIRIAIFTILAIHVVLLGALLIAGCKPTEEAAPPSGLADLTTNFPTPPPGGDMATPTANIPNPGQPPATATQVQPGLPVQPAPSVPGPYPVGGGFPVPGGTSTPISVPDHGAAPPAGSEHVVVKNDSFYTLAKKYGVSMKAIAAANPNVDSSRLKLGQKLVIPAPTPNTPGGSPTAIESGGEKVYTVRSGDNLNKIAKNNGVSVKALRSANNLRTDQIKVGQKLKIPVKAPAASAVTTPSPAGFPPGPEATPTSPPGFPPPPAPGNP